MNYHDFINSKHERHQSSGFTAGVLPSLLFDWQKKIVEWCCRKGRSAIFAECGLGKTGMQLAWCEQVVKHTNKPVLLLAPIAVGHQTKRESEKFGIQCDVGTVKSQSDVNGPGIYISNYESLHKFDASSFDGVCLDESSILKSFTGKTKQQLCNEFKDTPYKLACTATAAPNDNMELGNHSEFLGVMRSSEMLCRWFINDTMKAGGYRLCKHAKRDFWRWISSWAVCVSKPSDIGGDDTGFDLPPLNINKHIVESNEIPKGFLFKPEPHSVNATQVHNVKRQALNEKCDIVAEIVNSSSEEFTVWCDTNYEADALIKVIPDAVEVRGNTKDDLKAEYLTGFCNGNFRVLISKPEIAGFGMNFQHCHNTTYFAGFSFERWYQSVRRHWRFGQENEVNVHLVASELEESVIDTLERKSRDFSELQSAMTNAMREGMSIEFLGKRELSKYNPEKEMEIPKWLMPQS